MNTILILHNDNLAYEKLNIKVYVWSLQEATNLVFSIYITPFMSFTKSSYIKLTRFVCHWVCLSHLHKIMIIVLSVGLSWDSKPLSTYNMVIRYLHIKFTITVAVLRYKPTLKGKKNSFLLDLRQNNLQVVLIKFNT